MACTGPVRPYYRFPSRRPPCSANPKISYWENLVRDVRAAGGQRVVVSSEFFAEADDVTARRVVRDLGGSRVHVVVTLRSLTRILPSPWQQYLQNGFMRYGTVDHMKTARKPAPDEPRIATPAWALKRGAEISAEMAGRIEALGAFIAGGTAGQSAADLVRDLDARSLARELAKRCRQRLRRVLPRVTVPRCVPAPSRVRMAA